MVLLGAIGELERSLWKQSKDCQPHLCPQCNQRSCRLGVGNPPSILAMEHSADQKNQGDARHSLGNGCHVSCRDIPARTLHDKTCSLLSESGFVFMIARIPYVVQMERHDHDFLYVSAWALIDNILRCPHDPPH